MAYKKVEPLFGSPRGNAVMKAKRVHGESAQTILKRHVACEHCHVKGCKEPVLVTRNFDGVTKERACEFHFVKAHRGSADIRALLAMPTRNFG